MISSKKVPIIEFAFEDIRQMHKRQQKIDSIKKAQEQRKKQQESEIKPEEVEKKKKDRKNKEALAKVKLDEIFSKNDKSRVPEAKKYISMIRARGLKQRMKKKLREQFGDDGIQTESIKNPAVASILGEGRSKSRDAK